MSKSDLTYNQINPAERLPEYRLVEAYMQCLVFCFKSLEENSPYHLLTPSYRICLDDLKKALNRLRVEYATQIKFTDY